MFSFKSRNCDNELAVLYESGNTLLGAKSNVIKAIRKGVDIKSICKNVTPNILQSFGITGIVVLGMLVFSPVRFLFEDLMGEETATLLSYILSMSTPFWIITRIRRNKTNNNTFNFTIENKRIVPFHNSRNHGFAFWNNYPNRTFNSDTRKCETGYIVLKLIRPEFLHLF